MVKRSVLKSIITRRVNINNAVRIYQSKYPEPLGVGPSYSRFCHPSYAFKVVYLAVNLRTACGEVLLRDQFNDQNEASIDVQEIKSLTVARISSVESLQIVDMTGGAMISHRLRSGIVGNTDHRSGRAFSRDLYAANPRVDGILYPSRLIHDATCLAVYDRSIDKLTVVSCDPLDEDPRLPRILKDWRVECVLV